MPALIQVCWTRYPHAHPFPHRLATGCPITIATTKRSNRSHQQPGCRSLQSNILPKCATEILTALAANQYWWASKASAPTILRLGTSTHRSSVLVLDPIASNALATVPGKQIECTRPTSIYQSVQTRHSSNRQHGTSTQARFLPPGRRIPSDVRGSCGCSGAGSQPSRQARQVWLPLFPALTGLSRNQSDWLSSLTGRITEGSRQAFSDGYHCSERPSTLPARCKENWDDANGESARISAPCRVTVGRGRRSLGVNVWCGTGADRSDALFLFSWSLNRSQGRQYIAGFPSPGFPLAIVFSTNIPSPRCSDHASSPARSPPWPDSRPWPTPTSSEAKPC